MSKHGVLNMTTEQQTAADHVAAVTPLIHDLVEAGCPGLPEWVDLSCSPGIMGSAEIYPESASRPCLEHDVWVDNPSAVLSAVCTWVMGAVVPWARKSHNVYSQVHELPSQKGSFFYGVLIGDGADGETGNEPTYTLATIALLRAIHGVVCGKGGE